MNYSRDNHIAAKRGEPLLHSDRTEIAADLPKFTAARVHNRRLDMIFSAKANSIAMPVASHARRYGLALLSIAAALGLAHIFLYFHLPQPFAVFAFSAIAITFWYGGTKPGIVAVLLALIVRNSLEVPQRGPIALGF